MSAYAFLIPFYNHPARIKELADALKAYSLEIIIVDDGSDKESKKILSELDGVTILTRENNGGKGIAMKDGFSFAERNDFTHVLQIDEQKFLF